MEFSADVILRFAHLVWSNRESLARQPKDIVSDLRLVRFDDDGILPILKALARGRDVPDKLFVAKLADFNDSQWRVSDAIGRLEGDCPAISHMLRMELVQVAYRKRGVRADVQAALNESPEAYSLISRERAKELVLAVTQLNGAIETAEDIILHGRGHG